MKKIFFICCLLSFTSMVKAQHEALTSVSGIVIDAQSLNLLPYAHITRNRRQGIVVDKNGRFSIKINPQDTIEVSYIGYQSHTLTMQEKKENYVIVHMEPAIRMLQEIEVHFIPTKEELKDMIFGLRPTLQEIHARNNIALIKLYVAAMLQPEAYLYFNHPYIEGPSGFIFFSSQGQQGITRFVKSTSILYNQHTYFHLKPYKPPDHDLLRSVNITQEQADSLKASTRDSLLTKKSLNN